MATPFTITQEKRELLKKLYESGLNTVEIATLTNVSNSSVYYHLKRMRVEIRKNGGHESEGHYRWKGQDATVNSIHRWVKKRLPKPGRCQECKLSPPKDLANISPTYNPDTYNRELHNWEWLCRRCHMVKDGRLRKFIDMGRRKCNLESPANTAKN